MKKIISLFLIILLFTGCAQPSEQELAQMAAEIVLKSATPAPTEVPVDYDTIAQKAADILKEEMKVGDRIVYNNGKSFTFPISGLTPEGQIEYATISEYYFEVTEVNTFGDISTFEKGTDSKGMSTYYFYENKGIIVMKGTVSSEYAGKSLRSWNFANSAVIKEDGSFTFISDMQNVSKNYNLYSPVAIFIY